MPVERLLTRPSVIVSVTPSGDVDEYGNPQTETSRTDELCYLGPAGGRTNLPDEQNVDRQTTSDDWLYVIRAGAQLASVDHVEVDGETGTFEVVGDPSHVWNPRRQVVSHIEARLRRSQR